ncbi:hypothetical protein FRB94_001807 [Tulasnella sp. JGI-2019a]|nr:hypothetical protein FRB93_007060 [Tulasnella sp. JGI-2019a]KAG8987519.1 hypothetical protein FRB94_001807 [Tulasnella sp. JGI-2019a]
MHQACVEVPSSARISASNHYPHLHRFYRCSIGLDKINLAAKPLQVRIAFLHTFRNVYLAGPNPVVSDDEDDNEAITALPTFLNPEDDPSSARVEVGEEDGLIMIEGAALAVVPATTPVIKKKEFEGVLANLVSEPEAAPNGRHVSSTRQQQEEEDEKLEHDGHQDRDVDMLRPT